MEPEGSLPSSQVPATCPYPETARSSPDLHTHLPKIHINIILPSTSGSPQWSLSLRFHHQTPVHASLRPIRATCPTHLNLLDLITRTMLGDGYRLLSSSVEKFSPLPRYLVLLRPKYSPQNPILKHPHPTFLSQCQRPSFTPIKTGKIIVLYKHD
jgi:hypothetical protein